MLTVEINDNEEPRSAVLRGNTERSNGPRISVPGETFLGLRGFLIKSHIHFHENGMQKTKALAYLENYLTITCSWPMLTTFRLCCVSPDLPLSTSITSCSYHKQ